MLAQEAHTENRRITAIIGTSPKRMAVGFSQTNYSIARRVGEEGSRSAISGTAIRRTMTVPKTKTIPRIAVARAEREVRGREGWRKIYPHFVHWTRRRMVSA